VGNKTLGLLPDGALQSRLGPEEDFNMLVDTILQTKGGHVHTLPETGTLIDAVTALNTHNVGALVIIGAGNTVLGILSERDVVRRLGQHPEGIMALSIAQCMTRDVVTCARDTPIAEVMERMTRRHIRHMPVIEDGALMGIVSIGDVVKAKIEQAEREAEELREYIAS
jgi:CBS domain-containing protein